MKYFMFVLGLYNSAMAGWAAADQDWLWALGGVFVAGYCFMWFAREL